MMIAFTPLAAIVMLAGCGEANTGKSASTQPAADAKTIFADGTDPRIIVHDLSAIQDVLVGGDLAYLRDGKCLIVRGKRATEEFTAAPIWPKGTQPVQRDGKHGVTVPGFGDILESDTINAGGHYWEADEEMAADVSIDASCIPKSGFIIFNPQSFS